MSCDIRWEPVFAGIGETPNPHVVHTQVELLRQGDRAFLGALRAILQSMGPGVPIGGGTDHGRRWYFRVDGSHEVYVEHIYFLLNVQLHVIDISNEDRIRAHLLEVVRRWCVAYTQWEDAVVPWQAGLREVLPMLLAARYARTASSGQQVLQLLIEQDHKALFRQAREILGRPVRVGSAEETLQDLKDASERLATPAFGPPDYQAAVTRIFQKRTQAVGYSYLWVGDLRALLRDQVQ